MQLLLVVELVLPALELLRLMLQAHEREEVIRLHRHPDVLLVEVLGDLLLVVGVLI